MKYESNILERLIKTYGVVGNPKYVSEIIKQFIIQGKECYPNLFTYQSDWLAHIDEFGLANDYVVTYTGQRFYAPNTKERPVKRAILKGSTKYRDIDTGEVLDAFEDGRNLELVSVKMPVLTTTGKNLFGGELEIGSLSSTGTPVNDDNRKRSKDFFPFKGDVAYVITNTEQLYFYDENKNFISRSANKTDVSPTNTCFIKVRTTGSTEVQIEKGTVATSYEPYKSNILTTPEDLELRGIGDVRDELNVATGELTERIGEIKTNNIINEITITKRYTDKLIIRLPLTLKTTTSPTNLSCPYLLCDKLKTLSFKHGYADNTEIGVYVHDTNTDYIYMCILNSNLVSNDLDGIKEYLTANPSTIQYKLLESTVKTVDLNIKDQNNQVVNHLTSFEGGTHFDTSSQTGSVLPTLEVDVVVDLEETLKTCSLEGNTM